MNARKPRNAETSKWHPMRSAWAFAGVWVTVWAHPLFSAEPAQPQKPPRFIAVLPLQPGDPADAALAEKVTDSLRMKLARQIERLQSRTDLAFVSGRETDDALANADLSKVLGFEAKVAETGKIAQPGLVAGVLRERLSAHVGVIGRLTRTAPKHLILDLAVVDLTVNTDGWAWTARYEGDGERCVALVTDGPVEALTKTPLWRPREENSVPEPARLPPPLNKNPGLEDVAKDPKTGDEYPAFWQRPDGLCSFWGPGLGRKGTKGIRLFTDLPQSQADEWWPRWREGASCRQAPAALPTTGKPDYSSVAGLHGVHWYSDRIPIEAGVQHRIIAWHSSPTGKSKVFVKGYKMAVALRETEPTPREIWRQWQECQAGDWNKRSETFTPLPGVEFIKIDPYSYWPQGEYFFDDLSIHREPVSAPATQPGAPPA